MPKRAKMYDADAPLGAYQDGARPALKPRLTDGRCGHCGGDLRETPDGEIACWQCSRTSSLSPAQTPEEVRGLVRKELQELAKGLDPIVFWRTYVTLSELSDICGMHLRNFRPWMKRNGFEYETKKHPTTGKRCGFVPVEVAKQIIKSRQ